MFIKANLRLVPVPALPEIQLYTAHPGSGLRRLVDPHQSADDDAVEPDDDVPETQPPYWAYAWAGGAVLARYILNHPQSVAGRRVLDLGAGSGLVGIAAAKAGARSVMAAEIDRNGVAAIGLNAAANGVETKVHVVDSDASLPAGADILLANILCGPLCELAPRFAALTRPGGKIVLAGLLSAQADEVTRAHAPWFDIAPFASRDGWTALTGSRRV